MALSENKYTIDPRSREDIVRELDTLAKSYTPEWKLDRSNPDIGSSIALLFAYLLSGSVERTNMLHEKSRRELADMLNLAPHSATPAESVVRFLLSDVADGGVMIPKGTKLFADGEDGEPVHFETDRTIYATTAVADKLFLSNADTGSLTQLELPMGGEAMLLVSGRETGNFLPTILTMTHPYAFCFEAGSTLRIHFDGKAGINEILSQKEMFEWSFCSERGFEPFEQIWFDEKRDAVCLQAGGASTLWGEHEEFAVRVTSCIPMSGKLSAKGIYLDTDSTEITPEEVWCGDIKTQPDSFLPFGDLLSVFSECYIACDPVLTQCGARIVMKFNLAMAQKLVSEQIEQQELKVIMRKRTEKTALPADVYAQQVSFEYFNGIGWNRLPLSAASEGIFAGERSEIISLEFVCPKDIEPIEINAFFKNWIRVRIIKSEGCYAQNALHHYPVISNLSFSHSFGERACQPSEVYRMSERMLTEMGSRLRFSEECTLFSPMSLGGRSLLLGFKQPLQGGPLSLYLETQNNSVQSDFRLVAEYSAISGDGGFRSLQIVDFTDGLAHSGAVVFAVPPDMRSRMVFGEERFWIRFCILQSGKESCEPNILIKKIYLNGVEVSNRFTHKAENFYLSPLDSKTTLQLSATDILSADVFVNEAIALSVDEMKRIFEECPSDVQCTYDLLGSVQSFFVRWSEVTSFAASKVNDRHYILDRINSQLIFSDGTQAMSPPKQPDVAVLVTAVSTVGSKGNVAAHTIRQAYELLEYVDIIDNSQPAVNGSDIETREQLLGRAAGLLHSGNRIVTEKDLCKAVQGMSALITKVKLITGDRGFTLLVLSRDFEHGSQTFNGIKDRIKKEIFSQWEVVAEPSRFIVRQPDYLAVSVSGWLVMESGDADMELLASVKKTLRRFLNPITGGFSGNGWEIGNIPGRAQILSVIRSVCPNGRVEHLCVTGVIDGAHGTREYDLQEKNQLPQAVCVSGKHNIMAKIEMRGE